MDTNLTTKKKIFFVDGLINKSASQTFTFIEKISKEKENFEPFFVTTKHENMKWPYSKIPQNIFRIWKNGTYVRNLYSFFKKNNPSLIHFFFELRTFGTLRSAFKFPFLLFLLRTINTKIVLTIYNPFIFKKEESWHLVENIPFNVQTFIMKYLIHLYVKLISGLSDKIIVENRVVKSGLEEYFRIPENKILVINNAVAQEKEQISVTKEESYRKKFANKKIILCFGVISPRKGQSNAINAFKIIEEKLPDHILIIGGRLSPEFQLYEKQLLDTIHDLNLEEKIFYLGELDEDEINVLFEISDIALFPYHPAIYGSGAFSFALQYNIPSIVTSIDTFKEILGDDGGFFVDPNNDKQLADAIVTLSTDLKIREEIMNKMSATSKLRSCDDIALKHFDVYNNVLK